MFENKFSNIFLRKITGKGDASFRSIIIILIKIEIDTHTHTDASSHAYSSYDEMIREAARIGLSGLAITNHAPTLPDGPNEWHFNGITRLPKTVHGITVLYGSEVNILNYDGDMDLPDSLLQKLDIVIASMHSPAVPPSSETEHTRGWLNILDNPYVDILGHIGSTQYKCDYEQIAIKAAKNHKIIEINNHSFSVRPGSNENCVTVMELCNKYRVPMVLSSDAHSLHDIADYTHVIPLIEKLGIDRELILNRSIDKLKTFLKNRRQV